MLWADKRALETNLKLSLLQIRERELNFYTNNCMSIATVSSLLAGFAYAALMPGMSRAPAGPSACLTASLNDFTRTSAAAFLGSERPLAIAVMSSPVSCNLRRKS